MTTQSCKDLREAVCRVLADSMQIITDDETTVMAVYRGFNVQIRCSEQQPSMVVTCIKTLPAGRRKKARNRANELNLDGVFGCHAIETGSHDYLFRSGHWLPPAPSEELLADIIDSCVDCAAYGWQRLTG